MLTGAKSFCESRALMAWSRRLIGCGSATALAVGTECSCQRCSATPKPSYSPEFRLQAEARYLLSMSLAQRREYLQAKPVQGRVVALKAEMTRQFEAAR